MNDRLDHGFFLVQVALSHNEMTAHLDYHARHSPLLEGEPCDRCQQIRDEQRHWHLRASEPYDWTTP